MLALLVPVRSFAQGAACGGVILFDGVSCASPAPPFVPAAANDGAFLGGVTGTASDTGGNLNAANLRRQGGSFDIPTGGLPSPLFGAQPFTQRLLLFEEFGTEPLSVPGGPPMMCPAPPDPGSGPDGVALDAFLAHELAPYPTESADTADWNPWKPQIEAFLGRPLSHPPAEGRPPGAQWAHQRWGDFPPLVYFKTAQAGARPNLGLRDTRQRHGYAVGEFGPGGLYHNPAGVPGRDGTTAGIQVQIHPNMPVQDPLAVWTFDGTLPPKLLTARYGEPILLRHYNVLPIDPAANMGFGLHTISTHEHNGHNPAESDGYTNAFFFPGQFYDYRWPMTLAGHDTINTDASDPHAGTPDGQGGITKLRGDWHETMSTHWFHDHMLDFTAQNVYKGNAAMFNYYSALDRGREPASSSEATGGSAIPGYGCHYANATNVNLCLPSGSALDWGNRDYDVNLLVADKAWDHTGQLWFNIFNTDGFLGDQLLTNWQWKPSLEVRARRYRFRILNGSVSRYVKLALVTEANQPVPFYLIANDGNLMEHAVFFPTGELPEQAIAERYDIVVDFSAFVPGTHLYLVNLLEHRSGRRPNQAIPLQDVLSGAYRAVLQGSQWVNGDPAVGKFLELKVVAYAGVDRSMDPAQYVPGAKTMIPLPELTQAQLDGAIHRTFEFGRANGTDGAPWTIKTDGGVGLNMDPRRVAAAPRSGTLEVWHLQNGGSGWSHPVHVHFEEGRILRRNGLPPPPWEQWARKDVYRLGPTPESSDSVDLAFRFREFLGTYMEHCHNTQHEDNSMLLRWDVEHPGQMVVMPTPMPTWDGVGYVDSVALPTFRTGDAGAAMPVCGDQVRNQPGEQCDGLDAAACPGTCRSDCTCPGPAICGDNLVNRPTEECDGTDARSCPGACRPDCTCPGPPLPPVTTTTTPVSTTTTTTTRVAGPAATAVVVADVAVDAASAGKNFGTQTRLRADAGPKVVRSFLRVQVNGLSGRPVTSAILRLQVSSTKGAGSDRGGELHRTDCVWSETGLTFRTQPGFDLPVIDTKGAVLPGQTVDFDVTHVVTADDVYCFALVTASSHAVSYNSREAKAGRPQLLVSVGTASGVTTTSSSTTSTTRTTSTLLVTTTSSTVTTTSAGSPSPSITTSTNPARISAYQAGVDGPAGSANIDTYVRLAAPTTAFGATADVIVGVTNATDKVNRALMAFDLAGLPPGATVTGCTLRVNVAQRTSPTAGHVRRLCGEHWLDGDGQGEAQATWNTWETGGGWTVGGAGSAADCGAGGDYTTTGEVAYVPPAATGPFTFPDLTPLCQDAVTQRGGWLRLRVTQDAEGTAGNLFRFDSSEVATVANRPRLTVTWSAP